jgi:hypothetical protein
LNLLKEKADYEEFMLHISEPEIETLFLIKGSFNFPAANYYQKKIGTHLGKCFQFREISSYKVDSNQLSFTSSYRGQTKQDSFLLKGDQLTLGRLLPPEN